ncbi:hypothetical protein PCASD_06109 [Puccinia coronata f. sp. avenae]|uniref:Hydrophobin n=1 Tax=Puccinia coronata f. sp. avenae TaxID=200324 RepID=A0A2N5UZZ4_9BASI|nr:hypothetical protein PCASD_06109 [Puccinia coronata f. sp. avenae]
MRLLFTAVLLIAVCTFEASAALATSGTCPPVDKVPKQAVCKKGTPVKYVAASFDQSSGNFYCSIGIGTLACCPVNTVKEDGSVTQANLPDCHDKQAGKS